MSNHHTDYDKPTIGWSRFVSFTFILPPNTFMLTSNSIFDFIPCARNDLYNYTHTKTSVLYILLKKYMGCLISRVVEDLYPWLDAVHLPICIGIDRWWHYDMGTVFTSSVPCVGFHHADSPHKVQVIWSLELCYQLEQVDENSRVAVDPRCHDTKVMSLHYISYAHTYRISTTFSLKPRQVYFVNSMFTTQTLCVNRIYITESKLIIQITSKQSVWFITSYMLNTSEGDLRAHIIAKTRRPSAHLHLPEHYIFFFDKHKTVPRPTALRPRQKLPPFLRWQLQMHLSIKSIVFEVRWILFPSPINNIPPSVLIMALPQVE